MYVHFSQLQASVIADETLSIRANRTLREATAVYKKEEACLDIVIRLPSCYPLRAVEVDCTRRLGISETLLRKWILSMASFLRNQVHPLYKLPISGPNFKLQVGSYRVVLIKNMYSLRIIIFSL